MARTGTRYTEDQKTRGMLVIALNGGSVSRAHAQLAGEGLSVHEETLRRWRDTPRYLEIRETHARQIEEGLVDDYREVAVRSVELQLKATAQAIEEAEAKTLKDPGKTAQAAAVAGGIAVDKVLTLTGRPREIVGHFDPHAAGRELLRHFGIPVVDSTAEEIAPADELPQGE